MKSRAVHIVPLSKQAIEVLEKLSPLTGEGKYVFPGERSALRPMSENTVNAALRRLGYGKEEFTGHSFRKIASTLLNESHLWHRDAIERQLAHGERDEVRAAYNYAEHLPERIEMMQWWADYLDKLRVGADVIHVSRTPRLREKVSMRFHLAIEPGDETHAFGVVVPDLPGCFSAGDTLDEALANAREAIILHLSGLAEDSEDLPVVGSLEQHMKNPSYAGWLWATLEVDFPL
jgi:predicted RNase H-like HicB family nuclease